MSAERLPDSAAPLPGAGLPEALAIARIQCVQPILDVCARVTDMRYAVVAHVTEDRWLACAVRDNIDFNLPVGGELPIKSTLCNEVRRQARTIAFDHASADPAWRDHHTPQTYGLESYIAAPILLRNGEVFGTLCAIDPEPRAASRRETVLMFELFAQLIAAQLDSQDRLVASEAALLDAHETALLRDQFIAVLGHDLRSPLAAIEAGVQLLERKAGSDQARRILTEMRASTGRMGRLISDVLDFARGRLGGGLSVARRPATELAAMLTQVADELRAAHGRPVHVQLSLQAPVPCDPDRIAQLASNLLANALTHGAPDGPVGVRATTGDGGFELSVSNTGPAIPTDIQGALFLPFNRGGAADRRQGLGLGLYIASEIARSHGGELSVVSGPDETRFTFRMPLEPTA